MKRQCGEGLDDETGDQVEGVDGGERLEQPRRRVGLVWVKAKHHHCQRVTYNTPANHARDTTDQRMY